MPRTLRHLCTLTVLLVLGSSQSWAAFIRGVVRFRDGRFADKVVVRLRSDKIAFVTETTTDPRGKFDFDGLTPSTYHLTIEGQGFRPYEAMVDITVSKMDYQEITLIPDRDTEAKAVPPEGTVNAQEAEIPADAKKEYDAAKKSLDQKDADAAVKQYRKAIQLYPKYSAAYLDLGLLHLDMGKFDDAQSELQSANELNPNNPGGFLALGALLNRQKKFDDAEKALTHGLQLNPEVADGQYELAKTYWATGKWQDAEPHAQKAATLAPTMAPPHVLLGNIALRRQDTVGAVKEFQEYLKLDPNGPMAGGVKQMIEKIEANQKK
jgi:tetratricopeptide (TPR) repeat protein